MPPPTEGTPDDKAVSPEGGVSANHPIFEILPVHLAPTTSGKGKNTIRLVLVPVACWKLNNIRFAFGSSFVLPETKDEFLDLMRLRKKHSGAPLSVFGHADPVSDDISNKRLSGHRADSIYAVLTRDTSRWEKLYLAASPSEGWGPKCVQIMLAALHFPKPPATDAIRDFQTHAGLRVDGIAGPKTREKLFLAYMDLLCPEKLEKSDFLARGTDANGKGDVQGCSEFNPVMVFSKDELNKFKKPENKADRDAENEINRRVMILLFRPGTYYPADKWPCPRTAEGVEGCRKRFWSDGEFRRSSQTRRREFAISRDTFACRFYHRLVEASPCEGIDPVVYEFAFSV